MDGETARGDARAQVEEVRRAQLAAGRPALPRGVCALSAVCAGAGVALTAQGRGEWTHLGFVAAGVLCLAVAHLLPTGIRRRRGLRGYRGWTRTENTTLLLSAVVVVVCGLTGSPGLARVYAGLGVVAAATWYATLRGVLVAGGRVRS